MGMKGQGIGNSKSKNSDLGNWEQELGIGNRE